VPVYAEETVAEHVFALLLAISHRITEATKRTRDGNFSQEGLEGFDLRGKCLGVIGTGNIGVNVIEIALGFNMKVIAFDVKPDNQAASRLGYEYADIDTLLSKSDIITLHVPGNKKTRNLISKDAFSKMKRGVVLINTSRGFVVDIGALLEALVDKKVAATGLDVLPQEPTIREEAELLRSIFTEKHNLETLFAGHMLAHQPNVLITPHSAFNTREAKQRLLDTTLDNITAFTLGKPQNIVDQS
jgi:D-lactate dehydrogenase